MKATSNAPQRPGHWRKTYPDQQAEIPDADLYPHTSGCLQSNGSLRESSRVMTQRDCPGRLTTVSEQLGHMLGTLEDFEGRLSRIQHGEYAAEVARVRAALRLEASRLLLVRERLAQLPNVHIILTACSE